MTVAAVVEEGAFDAAARRLRLTPSAVSQRVKLLEEQLGRVLLVRSRPVQATEAGEAVIRLARQTALLERDTAEILGLVDDRSDPRITVSLAVDADSLATWLLPALMRAAEKLPISLELLRADQSQTVRALESGRATAAITSQNVPIAGCTSAWLGSLRYEAVASPDFVSHWFPGGVTSESLRGAPFLGFDREDDLQAMWLRARGVESISQLRHYLPSSHDLLRAVEGGLGWAMVPAPQASAGLADRRLTMLGGGHLDVALRWQQWSLRSRVLDALRNEVLTEARSSLGQPPTA